MTAPLFSIVIPTRNRAALLKHALRSALDQTFDDYEVVVLANNCQDDTRGVVSGMDDDRIKYFETHTTLSMPDNWELAWTKASGRYVTYLPDDDALVPTALRRLAESTLDGSPRVISWEDAPYYYPNWNEPRSRNTMLLFYFGEQLVENVPSSVYRQQCARFEFAWSSPLPKLLNCLVDREFFEAWRTRLGRLFFPIAPDYSFAWISTHVSPEIRVLHRPLTVRGISDHSIGSNAGLGAASKEFYREFGDFDFFAEAPLDIPISVNQIAGTFVRASRALAKQGIVVDELDRAAFLKAAAGQLSESRALLEEWPVLASKVQTAAAAISDVLADDVLAALSQLPTVTDNTENISALRARTARMALEDTARLGTSVAEHGGDAVCARCTLGLQRGVLAASDWQYLYIIGTEIDAFDPLAMSKRVDDYYDLLARCRGKRDHAKAELTAEYDQQTDVRLLTTLLRRLDNKLAIDVGAERGSFVRAFLDAGAQTVFAVEPYPGNVRALEEQFGDLPAVRILAVALSDHDGESTLHIAEDKTGQRNNAYHSLVAFDETPTIRRVDQVAVECRTLDSLAAEGRIPTEIGVLKIDAERSDFSILRGMGRVSAAVIMLEYWDSLAETVGVEPYRLSDVAEWLRGRGYSTFAVIKRNDEFEVLQLNDGSTRAGDWGNAIFVHDDVAATLSDVLFSAAAEAQEHLIEQATMFANECRNRMTVIDEQQRRIQLLEHEASVAAIGNELVVPDSVAIEDNSSEKHRKPALEQVAVAAMVETAATEGTPALIELVVRQSHMLDRIEARLAETTVSYELARRQVELEFKNSLEQAERLSAEAAAAAAARLAVIEEQQRALDHYRFWSWRERLQRYKSPKLGILYQYRPRPMAIPKRYLSLPTLPRTAPTLSIVTPSLNQGAFIERTIKSVVDQRYPFLEYVVQDAVSRDETPLILERYAERLTHVESRPDTGFANGINMGFSHTTGDIMAYLNSDDLLLPGTLHYVAAFFARHPEIDVVYGHRVIVDEYDAEIGRWVLPRHQDGVLSWADFVPQETLFWRRRIWDKAGGAIDETFRFAIDWDLLIRFRDAGARMHRLPRFLGAFRVHPHQKTSSSLQDLGAYEMNQIRQRAHGRQVSTTEISDALAGYLRTHIIYDKLYELGILRY